MVLMEDTLDSDRIEVTVAPQLKAGQSVRSLDATTLSRIALHPLQQGNVARVEELVSWLSSCASPEDLFEFQRHLFGAIYQMQERRGRCTRAAKRLQDGRSVQGDAPDLPPGADPTDVSTWQFEVFMCERLGRQLRCIGDGLAWKAFRYDRRFISTL